MATTTNQYEPSRASRWTGYVLSAVPVLLMTMGGIMKVARNPMVVAGFAKNGMPATFAVAIGIIELLCVVIYLIPSTAVLGAVLTTGYLGGAVMVHFQAHEIQG